MIKLNEEQQKVIDSIISEIESNANYPYGEFIKSSIKNNDFETIRELILIRSEFVHKNSVLFADYKNIYNECLKTIEILRENLV